MPWGYRRINSSRSRSTFPRSAWNTAGETMSLNRALAIYDVTEEQVRTADPPIECQWRSCHGNPYAVVKCADIAALERRVKVQAEEDKVKKLKEKLGEEGYIKMKADEKANAEAELAARIAAQKRENNVADTAGMIEVFMGLGGANAIDSLPKTIDGILLAKTAAKKEWYLQDGDLSDLETETTGRTKKYRLRDLIQKAEKRHGGVFPGPNEYRSSSHKKGPLKDKIKECPERTGQYMRYLWDVQDAECSKQPEDIVDEACKRVRAKLQTKVSEAAARMEAARKEMEQGRKGLKCFDGFAGTLRGKRALPDQQALAESTNKDSTEISNEAKKMKAN